MCVVNWAIKIAIFVLVLKNIGWVSNIVILKHWLVFRRYQAVRKTPGSKHVYFSRKTFQLSDKNRNKNKQIRSIIQISLTTQLTKIICQEMCNFNVIKAHAGFNKNHLLFNDISRFHRESLEQGNEIPTNYYSQFQVNIDVLDQLSLNEMSIN